MSIWTKKKKIKKHLQVIKMVSIFASTNTLTNMSKNERVPGVVVTLRIPEQVSDVVETSIIKAQQEWMLTGKVGEKPTKDEYYSMLLRRGLESSVEVHLPEDWNSEGNKVTVFVKKQLAIEREIQSVERREEL
jgi:hypothetical protein